MSGYIKKSGFSTSTEDWVEGLEPNIFPADYYNPETPGVINMLPWQQRCFEALANNPNWIIGAPTAAGKTYTIGWLVTEALRRNRGLRALIGVPQTIIGHGFLPEVERRLKFPDNYEFEWNPGHDLCRGDGDGNTKTEHLLEYFLAASSKNSINDRIVVCSHATVVNAYKRNPKAFKNILLVIDEAHHANYDEDEDGDRKLSNELGKVVEHFLDQSTKNRLGLTTATFFRGDGGSIIPAKYNDGEFFKRFDLPYDEFLAGLKYLKNINYDFYLCDGNYQKALNELFTTVEKTIVYVPLGSSSSVGTPEQDCQEVFKAIAQSEKPIVKECTRRPGLLLVKRGNKWIKVLDLVDKNTTNRELRKALLHDAHEHGDSSVIDVVVALKVGQEGSNWRWANREIILGPRNSPVNIIQTIGRLFRDAPGKHTVSICHLLPFNKKTATKEDLNTYLQAVLFIMMLEEVLNPPVLEVTKDGKKRKARISYLHNACKGDAPKELRIRKQILADFSEVAENDPEAENDREAFAEVVSNVLTEENIEPVPEIIDQLWAGHCIKSARAKKTEFEKLKGTESFKGVDYELINKVNTLDWARIAFAGLTGDTFKDLRQLINGNGGEKAAIERAVKIFTTYTIDAPPSKKHKNNKARTDAHRLYTMRLAKHGQGDYIWYPVLDEIANQYGWNGVFELNFLEDLEKQRILQLARETFEYCKLIGKIPSTTSKNVEERKIAIRINNWKQSFKNQNNGKSGRATVYPEILDIAVEFGFSDAFSTLEQKQFKKALNYCDWCDENGREPSQGKNSKINNPLEYIFAIWRNTQVQALNGNGDWVSYDSVVKLCKQRGWPLGYSK